MFYVRLHFEAVDECVFGDVRSTLSDETQDRVILLGLQIAVWHFRFIPKNILQMEPISPLCRFATHASMKCITMVLH